MKAQKLLDELLEAKKENPQQFKDMQLDLCDENGDFEILSFYVIPAGEGYVNRDYPRFCIDLEEQHQ